MSSVCSVALEIFQKPRFLGVRANQNRVPLYCMSSNRQLNATVHWYKAATYSSSKKDVVNEGRIEFYTRDLTENAYMQIRNLQVEDSGVYFCRINDTMGPGTQIKVVSKLSETNVSNSSLLKTSQLTQVFSSHRTHQSWKCSVQVQSEGWSHHPAGPAAGRVHRCYNAAQTKTGEEQEGKNTWDKPVLSQTLQLSRSEELE